MRNNILIYLYEIHQKNPHEWISLEEIAKNFKNGNPNFEADIHYLESKDLIESSIGKYRLASPNGVDKARLIIGSDIDYEKEKLKIQKERLSISKKSLSIAFFGLILSVFTIKSCSTVDSVHIQQRKNIHITGFFDDDQYLDEALLIFPNKINDDKGLYIRRSQTKENTLDIQITDPKELGMTWDENIAMRFDNKNHFLVINSQKSEIGVLKEKEVIIEGLKNHTLPAISRYSMKKNSEIICDIDYFNGVGKKYGVIFKEATKDIPLFVWDSSAIPEDCK